METFTVLYHSVVKDMEITLMQYYVLFTLYRVPNISQQGMADKIGVSRRGIGKVIRSLASSGLLIQSGRKYTPCEAFIKAIIAIEKGNKVPNQNRNKVPKPKAGEREQSSQSNENKVPKKREQSSHNNIKNINKDSVVQKKHTPPTLEVEMYNYLKQVKPELYKGTASPSDIRDLKQLFYKLRDSLKEDKMQEGNPYPSVHKSEILPKLKKFIEGLSDKVKENYFSVSFFVRRFDELEREAILNQNKNGKRKLTWKDFQ